jgi:hypothetical protein
MNNRKTTEIEREFVRDTFGNRYYGYMLKTKGWIPPQKMKEIYETYQSLIRGGDVFQALEMEEEKKLPRTWLNYVLSFEGLSRKDLNLKIKGDKD